MDVIKIDSITKFWPGVKALDGVSFNVEKGTIHGFLGPNGAGKSTTLNIITGIIPQTSGTIDISGTIGFLPEHSPLYGNMIVRKYLDFVGSIYDLSKEQRKSKIDELLKSCGLESVKNRLIKNLSKGFQQRTALAQTLIHNPDIIILDEPTVGLDPNSVIELRNLIISLKDKHTILLSSHQLSEIDKMCDDLTIINNGKVVKTGTKSEIKKMFKSKQIVIIEILNWDQDKLDKFEKNFAPEKVEQVDSKENTRIKVYFNTDIDNRRDIARFLVENECGLISMTEEKLELENIFKEITGS